MFYSLYLLRNTLSITVRWFLKSNIPWVMNRPVKCTGSRSVTRAEFL